MFIKYKRLKVTDPCGKQITNETEMVVQNRYYTGIHTTMKPPIRIINAIKYYQLKMFEITRSVFEK